MNYPIRTLEDGRQITYIPVDYNNEYILVIKPEYKDVEPFQGMNYDMFDKYFIECLYSHNDKVNIAQVKKIE